MSSTTKETEEASSSNSLPRKFGTEENDANTSEQRPPAKRQIANTVIEISDTESDDSDVCAVNSYQASADEVKRIRKEYSSTSSSSDYSSDSESPWEDDSIVIEDKKISEKAVRAQLNPRANRMDDPKINASFKSQEVIDKLRTYWQEEKDLSSDEVTLTCRPFRLCRLHDVLENAEIINNIVDDMNTLDWSRKKMDLYEFHQTTDLANLTWQRSIRGIYELLKTEVMNLVSQVSGLQLSAVSASCSLYGPGDHLLVHDDRLSDRRVAFVLYLAPWSPRAPPAPAPANGASDDDDVEEYVGSGWARGMGGALELFECDARGCPERVALRAFPANNTLAFFAVDARSFHQVGEVLSLELPRLTINGWFHGPAPPPAPPPPAPLHSHAPHAQLVLLNQWVEAPYLSARVRAQVQAQMERASEVCLRELLRPARCLQLLQALELPDVEWERCGPAHQRRYWRVRGAWAAEGAGAGAAAEAGAGAGAAAGAGEHAVRALLHVFSSGAFVRLLADCTDLQLAAYRRLELQRWAPGDFTLLPPREHYQQPRLEAVLYLGVPAHPVCGGHTVYVAPEEPAPAPAPAAALVTLPPVHNALSLVYCDAGAASFTKYLSKLTMRPHQHFYILTCTYTE